MTTAVSGLIEIGKTQTKSYQERTRFLESNGYYNVSGLRRFFAIEVDDYDDKEKLLHEVLATSGAYQGAAQWELTVKNCPPCQT